MRSTYVLLLLYINRSITKNFPIEALLEMINSSVKNLGKVEYDNQNCLKHQKNPVCRKVRSEVYVLLLLYINRSITKKFPTETLLEMIDSSIKNPGGIEYDNQNCLKQEKNPVCRKVRSEVYILLLLYINRSITKKFPIETLLEMMDSNVKNLGKVEYDR